jgi:hypothetical protein
MCSPPNSVGSAFAPGLSRYGSAIDHRGAAVVLAEFDLTTRLSAGARGVSRRVARAATEHRCAVIYTLRTNFSGALTDQQFFGEPTR